MVRRGLTLVGLWATVAWGQATVTVDLTHDVHPISPLIYGANFPSDAQVSEGGLTLARWGGNSTTRYNWQLDLSNSANDYYFENVPGCWSTAGNWCATPPTDPAATSQVNDFIARAQQQQLHALVTVPTLGWVAKGPVKYAHPFDCGCPRTQFPNQDSFDPYDSNCGNGQLNGQPLACAASNTSTAITPQWNTDWVTALTTRFGASQGQRIYALDNEPNLWPSTHRDVHPADPTYDELWQKARDNALAVLGADATAETSGPVEWGWPNYFCSAADHINQGCFATSPDRAAHGGVELTAWLLDQFHAYEVAHGQRLLHWLDLHYYPQGGSTPDITRSLWDPSYTDPSWIADTIRLLPRMHDWVSQHYPGTKLLISEYDWYHHNEALGAVLYADALGIFGREQLDAATAWSLPETTDIAFSAYRLFRNYDGHGAHFQDTAVRATTSGATGLNAYASVGATQLTLVLVNGGSSSVSPTVDLGTFAASGTAHWYTAAGSATVGLTSSPSVQSGHVGVTLPAMAIGLLVVDGVSGVDAGTPTDAGTPDAGAMTSDAGASTDAGASDSGTLLADAGTTQNPDGGSVDAGTGSPDVKGGCGCTTGDASLSLLLALGALTLRRRTQAPTT
jgi:hypothetical protein